MRLTWCSDISNTTLPARPVVCALPCSPLATVNVIFTLSINIYVLAMNMLSMMCIQARYAVLAISTPPAATALRTDSDTRHRGRPLTR